MSAPFTAMQYLATTGTAIAIGTNVQLASVHRCSDLAGTVTLKVGAVTLLTMSADRQMTWAIPIAISGPLELTSSAGLAFMIGYKKSKVS